MADAFPPTLFTSLVLMVTTAIALTGCSVKVDVADNERRVETETVPPDGIAAPVTDNGDGDESVVADPSAERTIDASSDNGAVASRQA